MPAAPHLIWKKSCDTCRRFKATLEAEGAVFTAREMNAEPLSAAELDALLGDAPPKDFLNTHNEVYRARGLSKALPPRTELIALLAEHNNLLRRPVLVVGGVAYCGNDLDRARRLLGLA